MSSDKLYEADSYTLTRLPCDSFSILWTVEDFKRFLDADYTQVESSEFQPLGPGTNSYTIMLQRRSQDNSVTISLKLTKNLTSNWVHFVVCFYLLDQSFEGHHKSEEFTPKITESTEDSKVLATYNVDKSRSEWVTYAMMNEAAKIRCEISVYTDPLNYPITSKTSAYLHYSQLIDDLHCIYENNNFSDGVIQAGEREFFISRAVLAARSPVFRTMFTCGLTESQNGRVKIDDFEPEVVQKMLDYIYTGRMSDIEDIALELLAAGHKYCIEGVQTLAQDELIKTIDDNNVFRLLIQADLYEAQMLKQQCITYIAQHRARVVKTEGWKEITALESHQLIVELIETAKDLQL